jgi:hypothetical protein
MPPVPPEQCSPYPGRPPAARRDRSDDTSAVHQRQGDRGSSDDDSAAWRALPVFVRYTDLEAAGIVNNWTTLLRLIDVEGFPPGVMIGPNTRAWRADEVEQWLAERPSARKIMPPGARGERHHRKATAP